MPLNEPFPDPAQLLIVPDHYIFRMLFSQGVRLEDLGVPTLDGSPVETDGRKIWRRFAENYHLFRGTPTRLWFDYVLSDLFGIDEPLSAATADAHYDRIAELPASDDFRPRALFERFNIEVIATTEGALDDLSWHGMIRDSGWKGRVVTAYRPDAVVDPDFEVFATISTGSARSPAATPAPGPAISTRIARAAPISRPSARPRPTTAIRPPRPPISPTRPPKNCSTASARGTADEREQRLFRAQMLTEMAKMSLDDGLVLQIHPGSWRNHSPAMLAEVRPRQGFRHPDPHRLCRRR